MQESRSVEEGDCPTYSYYRAELLLSTQKCWYSFVTEGEEEIDKQVCIAYFGTERTSEE